MHFDERQGRNGYNGCGSRQAILSRIVSRCSLGEFGERRTALARKVLPVG
jgi:hypothetical protein